MFVWPCISVLGPWNLNSLLLTFMLPSDSVITNKKQIQKQKQMPKKCTLECHHCQNHVLHCMSVNCCKSSFPHRTNKFNRDWWFALQWWIATSLLMFDYLPLNESDQHSCSHTVQQSICTEIPFQFYSLGKSLQHGKTKFCHDVVCSMLVLFISKKLICQVCSDIAEPSNDIWISTLARWWKTELHTTLAVVSLQLS